MFYKKADIEARVRMQNEIYEKYIQVDAPMQLNITTDMAKAVESKLANSIGNIDLFSEIESAVKTLFMIDVYPRFIKSQGDNI